MADASTSAKPPKKVDLYDRDMFYFGSPKKWKTSKHGGFSRRKWVGKQVPRIKNTNHAASQSGPAQSPLVQPAAAQPAPVQPAPVQIVVAQPAGAQPAAVQPAPIRVVVQDAERGASDADSSTTDAANTANGVEGLEARNQQPVTTTPAGTASPDTRHRRDPARSNSRAKRQQSKQVDTTKTAIKRTKKKKFRWAMDLENYRGTGIQRSDARIIYLGGPEYAAESSDSEDSSNESMTDPTPPFAMSSSRRPRYAGTQHVQPFDDVSGFSDTTYDAASSTASGTDIDAGQTHPSFSHISNRYYCNNTTSVVQNRSELEDHQGKSQEQRSTISSGRSVRKSSKKYLMPDFIQTNLKQDISTGQKSRRNTSTPSESELSYTFADLRRLKHTDYDPAFVQAVGRGDFGIPLPKKRHTHKSNSENATHERTSRRSRSDPGTTTSDADHQYKTVKHAINDAITNAEWNKGLSSGRSGNASRSGKRRCSLEIAREKGKVPLSSERQESKPQHSSKYPKLIFALRPDNDDDGRQPLIVFETQADYDALTKHNHRSQKQRGSSPPHPSDKVVPETRDERRKKGGSKTSRSSYQRPYVSDHNESD